MDPGLLSGLIFINIHQRVTHLKKKIVNGAFDLYILILRCQVTNRTELTQVYTGQFTTTEAAACCLPVVSGNIRHHQNTHSNVHK